MWCCSEDDGEGLWYSQEPDMSAAGSLDCESANPIPHFLSYTLFWYCIYSFFWGPLEGNTMGMGLNCRTRLGSRLGPAYFILTLPAKLIRSTQKLTGYDLCRCWRGGAKLPRDDVGLSFVVDCRGSMLQISKKWACCRQYRQQPYVIGYDLRNEPRGIPAQIASKLQLSPQGVA